MWDASWQAFSSPVSRWNLDREFKNSRFLSRFFPFVILRVRVYLSLYICAHVSVYKVYMQVYIFVLLVCIYTYIYVVCLCACLCIFILMCIVVCKYMCTRLCVCVSVDLGSWVCMPGFVCVCVVASHIHLPSSCPPSVTAWSAMHGVWQHGPRMRSWRQAVGQDTPRVNQFWCKAAMAAC